MKKLLYICNAHAGKAKVKGHVIDILDPMIQAGYRVEFYLTQGPGDATKVARTRGGKVDRILCSGGDGTLNEVVSGLMELPAEKRPPIAYVPAGTTNDYARSLEIPGQISRSIVIAADGTPRSVDVGQVGDLYFNYAFGFGIFTDVSYATKQEMKKVLGYQAYMLEGIRSLIDMKPYQMRITWEDQCLEGRFLLGLVTNSHSVAGIKGTWGENIQLDDGLFEVTLIREPPNVVKWAELPADLLSKEWENDLVFHFKTEQISFEAEEEVNWVKDGEFGGSFARAEVRNHHHAVQIIVKNK